MVMHNQAELLKTRFGKALSDEANEMDIISIPGLRNRSPKEISVKNLAGIIQARMEEITELMHNEIICSGYDQRLAGGIVITGGGSQLQNINQLFEYMTGMDCRIGYPNEHLGKSKIESVKSPMHATGVGLVLAGFKALDTRDTSRSYESSANTQKVATFGDGGIIKKIMDKTKKMLTDDLDEDLRY
jgi:cell division protein FtsA